MIIINQLVIEILYTKITKNEKHLSKLKANELLILLHFRPMTFYFDI